MQVGFGGLLKVWHFSLNAQQAGSSTLVCKKPSIRYQCTKCACGVVNTCIPGNLPSGFSNSVCLFVNLAEAWCV